MSKNVLTASPDWSCKRKLSGPRLAARDENRNDRYKPGCAFIHRGPRLILRPMFQQLLNSDVMPGMRRYHQLFRSLLVLLHRVQSSLSSLFLWIRPRAPLTIIGSSPCLSLECRTDSCLRLFDFCNRDDLERSTGA